MRLNVGDNHVVLLTFKVVGTVADELQERMVLQLQNSVHFEGEIDQNVALKLVNANRRNFP